MPATIMQPPANQPRDKQAPALVVPFTRAAKEHTEAMTDESRTMLTSSIQLSPYDVPSYGFMRYIVMEVVASGGSGTATVATQEDAPWSAIQEVSLIDVNGAPIVGPFSGYDLYLINKYGGYLGPASDPKLSPAYSAPVTGANASGNFSFMLRIPIEISARDGLGALPNQNAASTYKLRVTLAPSTSVYSTAPTNLPTVRIRTDLEAWTQPTATDLRGNANAQQPPAVGTTSYWSKATYNVPSGQQTVRMTRVGNYIRHMLFVFRATSDGTRNTGSGNFPDPLTTMWDTRILQALRTNVWKDEMARRYDYTATIETARGLDKAVFVRDFAHDFDGRVGYELRDGWLPTAQSTRLEVQGTFGAAGTLTVLTNDVSPAGEIFV